MTKRLFHYIKGFEKEAIKAPLFILIEAVCELFLPLLMADIIDVGINGDGGMSCIWKAGLGMLLLSVLSLYSGMTAAKTAAVASQGFGRNLRGAMFDKIQNFSFADIDRFSSASLITRLTNDVNSIQMTVMMCLRMLVRAPVQLLSALVVCLVMNARLTLVIVVVIPVMCLLLWLIMRACERLFTRFQQKIDALNNTVQENLVAIRVVKAFVRGDFERKKFKKSNDELRDAGLAAVMRVILISPVMMLSMYAAILGVMWFGGGFVAKGELLPGELYAFFSYIVQVLMSVLMVGMCLLMLTRAVACAKRVLEVLDAEPDISDSPESHERELPESRGRVEFKNVSFKYSAAGTGDDVLHGIDLTVEPGQFVAIVGGLFAFGGMLDLGGLAIYLQFGRQISQPMSQVSQQMTSLLSALAGAERIFEIIDMEPEVDNGTVTLVGAQKDANGAITEHTGAGRPHTWAWKVPRSSRLTLVPVMVEPGGSPVELGQAVHEPDGSLRMLRPNEDSPEGIWVRAEKDGGLTEVTDLSALASHRWAWKYPDREGSSTLHIVRGSVRNVPGEDYCLTELKGAVRLNDVCFSYVPEKPILKHVSVYANPGQKIAFVGSTGAGKTTITNLINRFYEIDSGMITYDGIDVCDIRKDDLRRSLGSVLQDTHLFTGTVMENIRYGRLDAADEECIAAAKSANAHSFIRRLPDGYNTQVTGDGANLSQGQRQLLAIARAAVADPPVMVLDEATSSIDTRTERHIERGMDALMEGRTVFVIAHRLSTVRNSNCIVVIEHGEIQEKGDHEALLAEKGRYYMLYTGQHILD